MQSYWNKKIRLFLFQCMYHVWLIHDTYTVKRKDSYMIRALEQEKTYRLVLFQCIHGVSYHTPPSKGTDFLSRMFWMYVQCTILAAQTEKSLYVQIICLPHSILLIIDIRYQNLIQLFNMRRGEPWSLKNNLVIDPLYYAHLWRHGQLARNHQLINPMFNSLLTDWPLSHQRTGSPSASLAELRWHRRGIVPQKQNGTARRSYTGNLSLSPWCQ